MTKRDRLERIIERYAGGNKSKFAAMLGVSRQCVASWQARDTYDTELIYRSCPGLSAKWLITGDGGMYESSDTSDAIQVLIDRVQALSEELGRIKKN